MRTYKELDMSTSRFIIYSALVLALVFAGCGSGSSSEGTGTVSLGLTDAPLVDDDNVTGVYITITGIEYHTQGGWKTMEDFNTSINPINLLDWQDGNSISLGDFHMPAGKYTQMRFMLDAAEESQPPQSNTGCFIEFNNDTNETLYVPSGSQTGYKAIGNYDVPVNGVVNMTADFDIRKSVISSANGSYYKLKPTIKLVVTDEAGKIKGTVSNLDINSRYVIYAYEYVNGLSTWDINEEYDPEPLDSADICFANAVSSTRIKESGAYTLAFLAAGTYDLIIAKYDVNGIYGPYYIETEIEVVSEQITSFDWTL